MNEIVIYQGPDNTTQIEVQFDNETVWLSQSQLVDLFLSSKANISEHIANIFKSGELNNSTTVRKFRTVRKEGNRSVSREIEHYNLDVIISVGYRVNTLRGVQFRQWATQRLKEYLVQGYTINQKRLDELQQTVELIQKSIDSETNLSEAKGLLEIISQYTQSFIHFNQFSISTQ